MDSYLIQFINLLAMTRNVVLCVNHRVSLESKCNSEL